MDPIRSPKLDNVKHGANYRVGECAESDGLIAEESLCVFFDGLNAALEYVRKEMPKPKQEESSATQGTNSRFYSFNTYDEALHTYLKNPSKVRDFLPSDSVLVEEEAAGMDVQYDLSGDFLDIARFLGGEPECFGNAMNGKPSAWRVNLLLNISWSAAVPAEVVNERSRRIQRLVDWLESQNIRTSIRAVRSTQCSHSEILLKEFDEPLDINDVAVVSHGDFLRRILFRVDEYSETWSSGYGNPRNLSAWLKKNPILPELNTELTIVVDNSSDKVKMAKDFEAIEAWVQERITTVGEEPEMRSKTICEGDVGLAGLFKDPGVYGAGGDVRRELDRRYADELRRYLLDVDPPRYRVDPKDAFRDWKW